ncbi:hypothetical protein [Duganella sp. Dugasp56]
MKKYFSKTTLRGMVGGTFRLCRAVLKMLASRPAVVYPSIAAAMQRKSI